MVRENGSTERLTSKSIATLNYTMLCLIVLIVSVLLLIVQLLKGITEIKPPLSLFCLLFLLKSAHVKLYCSLK